MPATTHPRTRLALALLATTAAALATLLTSPTTTTTDASDRETGTVKWVTEAKSAGDKKVDVIK
ncbi:hypothetical protein [Streptomyces hydrogenans]|uniref:Uncharacterized protein n=1 Tax=Streptomyces hydrogenans TaxID=1873719 RepID=A0ABQ3P8C1_9ACTN|nr:hypothetical protein [Streptomyces hydrogenans]GHG18560.1 hypothetical protein GCM10018784_34630 [Streptomyces hydrogenans]GHI21258.1 hypothetical protein Shyd_26290 [Streptomyces hydrogenans]